MTALNNLDNDKNAMVNLHHRKWYCSVQTALRNCICSKYTQVVIKVIFICDIMATSKASVALCWIIKQTFGIRSSEIAGYAEVGVLDVVLDSLPKLWP